MLSQNAINEITNKFALNIFSSNIQSLSKNIDELLLSLKNLNYPEVLALSELWQPPHSLLTLQTYQNPLFKLRSNKSGGGIAIWVKKGIKILHTDNLIHLNLKMLEAVSVKIEVQYKTVTIINVYRAPNKNPNQSLAELEALLQYHSNISTTFILTGDLNLNTLNTDSKIIKDYLNLLDLFHLNQCVKSATRITSKSATLIDHIVTNKPNLVNVNVLEHAIADHQTVVTSIFRGKTPKTLSKTSHASKVMLNESITSIENNINWPAEINTLKKLNANLGMEHLLNIINLNLVKKTFKTCSRNSIPKKHWINRDAIDLRYQTELARKKFLRSKTVANEKEFKAMKKKYKQLLKNLKQTYYHKQISMANGNGKKIWQTINEILHRKVTTNHEPVSLIDETGSVTSDPSKVANIFNNFYINFAPDLASKIPTPSISIEQYLSKAPQPKNSFSFKQITTEEINSIIKGLKPKHSSGFDCISNNLIKGLNNCIAEPIKIILNKSFLEGGFPSCIKTAKIVTIFKDGDKNNPSNYLSLIHI